MKKHPAGNQVRAFFIMHKLLKRGVAVNLTVRILFFIFLFVSSAFSFTDQTTTERILKENRSFIDFINVSVTNFGTSENESTFKNIYEMHFNAYVAYLQSDYRRAYKKVYESQGSQVSLYSEIIKDYLENAKDILDSLAPDIIKSRNEKAKLYLTLGYRERTVARNSYVMGNATNPKQYSYKLFHFVQAVKRARRAKRYGFLALLESQVNDVKRKIYFRLIEEEKKNGNPFLTRFLGKTGDTYLDEMNKKYEDKQDSETGEVNPSVKNVSPETTKIEEALEKKLQQDKWYERKVEKKVRFRNEKQVAEYLYFFQFDQASDIFYKYIDDLNFKLIQTTFDVLKTEGNNTDTDFSSFYLHHTDDYARLSKKSAILNFINTLKVEDDISREAIAAEEETLKAEKTGIEKKKNTDNIVTEKPVNKDDKKQTPVK